MKKKIIRRRNTRKKSIFIIFLFSVITFLGVGYSVLSESISVNGSAVANYVVSGNVLKLNLVNNGTGEATYSSGNFPTKFANFTSETLSSNYLTLTFTRTQTYKTATTCTFIINFTNPYPYTMTSGTRTNTTVSGGQNVNSFASALSTTSIAPGGTGRLTITARLKTSITNVIQLQTRIAYVVNGVTQYFYYVVKVN